MLRELDVALDDEPVEGSSDLGVLELDPQALEVPLGRLVVGQGLVQDLLADQLAAVQLLRSLVGQAGLFEAYLRDVELGTDLAVVDACEQIAFAHPAGPPRQRAW